MGAENQNSMNKMQKWGWVAAALLVAGCMTQRPSAHRVRGAYSPGAEKALKELEADESLGSTQSDFQFGPKEQDAIRQGLAKIQAYTSGATTKMESMPGAYAPAPPVMAVANSPVVYAPPASNTAPTYRPPQAVSVPTDPPRTAIPDIEPRPVPGMGSPRYGY